MASAGEQRRKNEADDLASAPERHPRAERTGSALGPTTAGRADRPAISASVAANDIWKLGLDHRFRRQQGGRTSAANGERAEC